MISWCLFWHADKHQSLLQVAINLGVHSQACPKYPKQVCLSLQYLQKKWVVKFLFCLQIKSWFLPAGKQKIVLQVDIIIWYYQYLSNISKKMLRMKLIFCLGINIKSFLKLIPSFLVCVCVARRLLFLCNILWKKLVMKLILCMHWSMKFSYKSILWFWLGCSSILKVPKLGSL